MFPLKNQSPVSAEELHRQLHRRSVVERCYLENVRFRSCRVRLLGSEKSPRVD